MIWCIANSYPYPSKARRLWNWKTLGAPTPTAYEATPGTCRYMMGTHSYLSACVFSVKWPPYWGDDKDASGPLS